MFLIYFSIQLVLILKESLRLEKVQKIIPDFKKYDIFTTIDGNQIDLLDGYKNYIWPESFDEMVKDQSIPDSTLLKEIRL